jgi:putative transposase
MYPTVEQEVLISKHVGHCRWIYNWGLVIKQQTYSDTGRNITKYELSNLLPEMKKTKETEWLKEVNSQSLQASLDNLDKAFVSFFEKRSNFPKFKTKRRSKYSFIVPSGTMVDFDHGVLYLPKFKESIKVKLHRKIEGVVKRSIISKNSANEYYISILVEDEQEIPQKVTISSQESVLGIDVGLKDFCTTSDGEVVENQHFLKTKQAKIKKLQKEMQHKERGSKNREKVRLAIARLHLKISNKRSDFLHKLSTRLIRENQAVAREDLNVKGMMQNHKLAGSISEVAWNEFDRFLKYKAEWKGKHFLQIGRFEASSKTCNICGNVHSLKLSDRKWVCEKCKTIHDRDVNAAINIRNWAFRSYERIMNDGRGIHTQGHGKVKSVSPKGNKKSKSKDEVTSGQKEDPARTSLINTHY